LNAYPAQNLDQKKKMTTYLTDYFIECFNDEYERHESDEDMFAFWGYFCEEGTNEDEHPMWNPGGVRDWVKEILSMQGGYENMSPMFQRAIYMDIDEGAILLHIQEKHQEWNESEHFLNADSESEESADDEEQTDPLPLPEENAPTLGEADPSDGKYVCGLCHEKFADTQFLQYTVHYESCCQRHPLATYEP